MRLNYQYPHDINNTSIFQSLSLRYPHRKQRIITSLTRSPHLLVLSTVWFKSIVSSFHIQVSFKPRQYKIAHATHAHFNTFHPQSTFDRSLTTSSMSSDEVEAAKVAATTYQSSDKDGAGPSTIFDKLLSKEWPSEKVYEDEKAYAFRDVNPQAPTHILVIPKVRDGLVGISKMREDQKSLLGHLMYVAQDIGKKECPSGFRLVVNDGVDGAQSVYHLHIHILGGRQMEWPPG